MIDLEVEVESIGMVVDDHGARLGNIERILKLVDEADEDDRRSPEVDAYDRVLAELDKSVAVLRERFILHDIHGRTREGQFCEAEAAVLRRFRQKVEHMKAEVTG